MANNYCRLCLKRVTDDGEDILISKVNDNSAIDVIDELLDLKIETNSESFELGPQKLCDSCHIVLEMAHGMKIFSWHSHEKIESGFYRYLADGAATELAEIMEQISSDEEMSYPEPQLPAKPVAPTKKLTSKDIGACDICRKKMRVASIRRHKREMHMTKAFVCRICMHEFARVHHYNRHVKFCERRKAKNDEKLAVKRRSYAKKVGKVGPNGEVPKEKKGTKKNKDKDRMVTKENDRNKDKKNKDKDRMVTKENDRKDKKDKKKKKEAKKPKNDEDIIEIKSLTHITVVNCSDCDRLFTSQAAMKIHFYEDHCNVFSGKIPKLENYDDRYEITYL